MDDAWDIAEDRQKDVYPKLLAYSHLQKHPQRWEKNRGHDAPKIHRISFRKTQIRYVADELQAYTRGPKPDSPSPIGVGVPNRGRSRVGSIGRWGDSPAPMGV
jgi:hypothetical protein